MAFKLLNEATYSLSDPIAITDGQTVEVGDILRLTSNRLRRAVSAGSDWYGLCADTSSGGGSGTGNSGGTVTARVWVFRGTPPELMVPYTTAVNPGDYLDLNSGADGVEASSDVDFIVQQQDSADTTVIVQPIAGRILNSGIPGGLLSADDVAALQAALGTPSSSEPFGTFVYTLGQLAGAKVYAFTATGSNGAGNVAVTSKVTGISPAAGDKIIFAAHMVTADSTALTLLQVGATDVDETLVSSSGIKLAQINAADWSTKTIIGLAVKVA